jgi:hypothetical protein
MRISRDLPQIGYGLGGCTIRASSQAPITSKVRAELKLGDAAVTP